MAKFKKSKKTDWLDGLPTMTCACCTDCLELLMPDGTPSGHCMFGGPFHGYVNAEERKEESKTSSDK